MKWSHSNDEVRRRVLEIIRDTELYIGCIVLNKAKVREDLRSPPILYNYQIVHFMLWDLLPAKFKPEEGMDVCVDLSMRKESRTAFNEYFKSKARWIWTQELKRPSFEERRINVHHENSEKAICLQASDYVAGAAFSRYERGSAFYSMIENKVQLNPLFF